MYVEVIECENVFTTPLTPKLLDNNLKSVKSQENLFVSNTLVLPTTTTSLNANNGSTESETNSQLNFNLQEAGDTTMTAKSTAKPATVTVTNEQAVTFASTSTALFDANNFDRWSISSDLGPINAYPNGNCKVINN